MDKILGKIKKIIPKSVFRLFQPAYHFLLALTGNIAYRFPGYKMTVIGVTGTNGKSTCVEIITEVLKTTGKKVGMISTVDIEIAGERRENKAGRTTIGRWGTHRLMREMVKSGCKYAVMEVSSEGIAGKRIWGIPFDGAVFTCLAPEHLNYHKTMENYRNTKGKLFKKLPSSYNFKKTKRVSVVNADDKEANYFHSFKADQKYTFGIKNSDFSSPSSRSIAEGPLHDTGKGFLCSLFHGVGRNDKTASKTFDVIAKNIKLESDGAEFEIVDGGKSYQVRTKALGEFNVLNELASYCVGLGYGVSPEKMIKALENFKGTRGRAEKIYEGQDFDVIVDYAVTPDAQKILYKSLREITDGKLISVFGATGDRDKAKRPDMGRVARSEERRVGKECRSRWSPYH